MIGVDTHLLVRILIEDDTEQLRRARSLLDGAAERSETAFVGDIVLAEIEWVLEDALKVPGKAELSDYLIGLSGSQHGASTTYTFDRDLRDDARFTLL